MAKMFITEGEGNQQTLSDIQSEKIPIYDSQQDAESDLANLAEGQIYATKEGKFDVDDMKDYIRKQNVLSDFENISLSSTETTMDYDGILYCSVQNPAGSSAVATIVISVNGIIIYSSTPASSVNMYASAILDVKKGDKVKSLGNSLFLSKARFYKLRDYKDR